MAIKHINNRQYPRVVVAEVDGSLSNGDTFLLPPHALVIGGGYSVTTAVAGTTPTLTLTDDAGSPHKFLDAVSTASVAAGNLAASTANRYYPSGATLTFTQGGTPTAGTGKVLVHVWYVEVGAEHELYGRSDG